MEEIRLPVIKVVGISAGGKSTLVAHLRQAGYNARAVSQEHSNIPTLWQQFDRTRVLIYLDVSLEAQRQRRPDVTWDAANLQMEQDCLAHARDHADLKIDTSALTPDTVWRLVHAYLTQQRIRHAKQPLPPPWHSPLAVVQIPLAPQRANRWPRLPPLPIRRGSMLSLRPNLVATKWATPMQN